MSADFRGRLAALWRVLRSRYTPAAVLTVLLVGLVIWAVPRKVEWYVSADGRQEWDAAQAPPRRLVTWEPPRPVEVMSGEGGGDLFSPRLADGGGTLYFTHCPKGGQADVYRSRLADGRWQPAEPVAGLNSEADDIGPVLSADGRHVYFYSNRPGGHGGFDLYLSERTDRGWAAPRNLGPAVNSPAHEYDPAPAPDGLALYFSSNRTPKMNERAAREEGAWAATLRAHPGLTHFDLYVTRRDAPGESWLAPRPLEELNLPDDNEGAPFVSPTGTYLYFASDRPARPGERPNLDLYRSRITEDRPGPAENLGAEINTAAHETEPALSPEGFTLVFASDRDGGDGLYRSRAREVYARAEWDDSRWQIIASLWWKVLLISLVAGALLALLVYSRGTILEQAVVARFLVASLLVHALLVLLLILTPLPEVLTALAETIQIKPAPQFFDQGPSQARQAGRPAYEKVADLEAVETALPTEVSRQAAALPDSLPRTNTLRASLPAPSAHTVPLERVPAAPAASTAVTRPAQELRRLSRAIPTRVAGLMPAAAEPAPAAAAPAERPLPEPAVALNRRAPMPPDRPELDPPRRAPETPPAPADLRSVNATNPARATPAPLPSPLEDRPRPSRSPHPAAELAKAPLPARIETGAKSPEPAAASVNLPRREPMGSGADEMPAERINLASGLPSAAGKAEPLQARPGREGPKPGAVESPLARATSRPNLPALLPGEEANPAPVAAAPGEKPLPGANVSVRRKETSPEGVNVPTPAELVRKGAVPRLPPVAGGPPERPAESRPVINPLAKRLPRAPEPGNRVAQLDEQTDLRQLFILRDQKTRKDLIEKFGGSKESEAAVEKGLDWLAANQNDDGSWSLHKHEGHIMSDTAGTGLGLLPFLGAGYTHQSGKHKETVAKALEWLRDHQKANGDLLARGNAQHMYSHGIAAIALCEAYGLTRDPKLREPAQKALEFIVKAQHDASGGWRYSPNQRGDTSVLGWQVMALKSGEIAGLSVPEKTLEGAERWLASVEGNKPVGGQFGYQNRHPTPTMTAQGLLSLQFMGMRRDDPRLKAGVEYLLKSPPDQRKNTSYYHYNATQVLYHLQGKAWREWNGTMRDALVKSQVTRGRKAGSWDPTDIWERSGGRIFATSLRLLMLEVYYRHLPLYRSLEE